MLRVGSLFSDETGCFSAALACGVFNATHNLISHALADPDLLCSVSSPAT